MPSSAAIANDATTITRTLQIRLSEHLAFTLLILVKALPKVAIFMRPLEQSFSPWATRFSITSHCFC
jgi:hypothetical protein